MALFVAKFKIRDGESEYYLPKGVVADGMCEAFSKAESYSRTYFGENSEKEDTWYVGRGGWPAIRLDSVTEVRTMEELTAAVGTV
jgi:hypothetical protein